MLERVRRTPGLALDSHILNAGFVYDPRGRATLAENCVLGWCAERGVRMMEAGEDRLCGSFAEHVLHDGTFRAWLLQKTKFAPFASEARLLHEEQCRRPAKARGRHRWCKLPSVGRDSETDIFLAFSTPCETRFALHVENKIAAPFRAFQPEIYPLWAAHMRFNRWVPYEDYATVFVAPLRYLEKNGDRCAPFDVIISHEEIRTTLPGF